MRRAALLAAACAASVAVTLPSPTPAGAAVVDGGDVSIVDTEGRGLDRGGSATRFELRLPANAACPGDSLHDQWVVQSFVVPAAADPASLSYDNVGPTGTDEYALYRLDTSPFVDALTFANDEAGKPGRFGLPAFTFDEFPPGTLPEGNYRIGIACTTGARQTGVFWDVEVVVTAEPSDQPGQMRWRLATAPAAAPRSSDGNAWVVVLVVVAVAAGAVLAVATLRRARHTPRTTRTAR